MKSEKTPAPAHVTLIYGAKQSGKSWVAQGCVNQALTTPARATDHAKTIEVFDPAKLNDQVDEALKKHREVFVVCNGFVPSVREMHKHRPEVKVFTIETNATN